MCCLAIVVIFVGHGGAKRFSHKMGKATKKGNFYGGGGGHKKLPRVLNPRLVYLN